MVVVIVEVLLLLELIKEEFVSFLTTYFLYIILNVYEISKKININLWFVNIHVILVYILILRRARVYNNICSYSFIFIKKNNNV